MQIFGPSSVNGAQPVKLSTRPAVETGASQPFAAPVDELQLSAEAQRLSQTSGAGEVRTDRVAALRTEIAQGTYETPDKLEIAVDRMLDELG